MDKWFIIGMRRGGAHLKRIVIQKEYLFFKIYSKETLSSWITQLELKKKVKFTFCSISCVSTSSRHENLEIESEWTVRKKNN